MRDNFDLADAAVSSMTKIIVYKQFTTQFRQHNPLFSCFQYDKDNSL